MSELLLTRADKADLRQLLEDIYDAATLSARTVAEEVVAQSKRFEHVDPAALVPFIERWQETQ